MTNDRPTPVWEFSQRTYNLNERTLVMGIINVTPDSFSDGGRFNSVETALARAGEMAAEGADLLDVGGESTRPGGAAVSTQKELDRVIPIVEKLAAEFDLPVSVDTTKVEVARAALTVGAEIINDISGLRFEPELASVVAEHSAGLILMHSRGQMDSLHSQPPVADIFDEVIGGLHAAADEAARRGVSRQSIVLDPGVGFGKTVEQNLALVANFHTLVDALPEYGWLVGTSRKSFIGKLLGDAPVTERLHGSLATATAAVLGGAHMVRVHDVKETVATVRIAEALRFQRTDLTPADSNR